MAKSDKKEHPTSIRWGNAEGREHDRTADRLIEAGHHGFKSRSDVWRAAIETGLRHLQSEVSTPAESIDAKGEAESRKLPWALERFRELRSRYEAGTLGLTPDERVRLEREYMNPVRALAAEEATRMSARLSTMGDHSARSITRVQREHQRRVDENRRAAFQEINRLHAEARAEQLQELSRLSERFE